MRLVPESEFDEDQHGMLAALVEYEASLNDLGIPIDEATAKEADPAFRGGWRYEVDSVIDWTEQAVREHLKSKGNDDPYSGARKVRVRRVDA